MQSLKKGYVHYSGNLKKVKGRINVIRNERTNMAIKRFDRVFCEYDEYTVDIPENKLIKKALLFCKQILRTVIEHHKDGSKVKQMLSKSLLMFERVSEDVQVREVTQIKAHKLFNEYSEAVRLAKLILRRYDFSISKTSTEDDNILPFTLDMSLLYEHYVYGLLHSKQYRERFADDLKKSLPRIPIVDNVQDFMAFYKAGKELADLHLNYEQGINIPATEQGAVAYSEMSAQAQRTLGVIVTGDIDIWQDEWTEETYQYFAVEKMRFAKVRDENGKLIADKTHIIYNSHITIENIPLKAYEYIVNGKSAIEWIMERYAVTIDKASQIKNNPNDWSKEREQPRYILDLLLSVIILSCKTVDVTSTFPFCKW